MKDFVGRLIRWMHKVLTTPATQPWSPAVRDYPRKVGSRVHSTARC